MSVQSFDNYQTINRFTISEASPEEFYNHFQENRNRLKLADRWRLDNHDLSYYQNVARNGGHLLVTENGSTLAVQKSGEMISLCRAQNEDVSMKEFVQYATRYNGRFFSCYEYYEDFFKSCGNIKIDEQVWNQLLAPPDWNMAYGTENVDMFVTEQEMLRIRERVMEQYHFNQPPSTEDVLKISQHISLCNNAKVHFDDDSLPLTEKLKYADIMTQEKRQLNQVIAEIRYTQEPDLEKMNQTSRDVR